MVSADKAHDGPRAVRRALGRLRELTGIGAPARQVPLATVAASDLDVIMEEEPPKALQMTGYVVSSLLAVVTTISALVEVDVVVEGKGELAMDTPSIVLQPLERAIIRSTYVKPGDAVIKGQILAKLDPTFVEADVAALEAQSGSLKAQVLRLEAEVAGKSFDEAPGQDANEAMQAKIFRQRKDQFESRLRALDEQIEKSGGVIKSLASELDLLVQQLSIAQEVERMRTELTRVELGSKLQLFESQNARLRAEREQREAKSRIAEAEHDFESRKAERQGFIEEWRRHVLEDLQRTRTELTKVSEVTSKAERMRQLVEVKAPQDGVVLEVANRSAGSVLREAEPLIILVPSDGTMIAEVQVRSSDVGHVRIGDPVMIKVDAFPYQRHGMLEGTVHSVSEGSFAPRAGGGPEGSPMGNEMRASAAMHRLRVALTKLNLDHIPAGGRIIPGMTVTAEVKVGTRSILAYFLDPIRRGFDESLREP